MHVMKKKIKPIFFFFWKQKSLKRELVLSVFIFVFLSIGVLWVSLLLPLRFQGNEVWIQGLSSVVSFTDFTRTMYNVTARSLECREWSGEGRRHWKDAKKVCHPSPLITCIHSISVSVKKTPRFASNLQNNLWQHCWYLMIRICCCSVFTILGF